MSQNVALKLITFRKVSLDMMDYANTREQKTKEEISAD